MVITKEYVEREGLTLKIEVYYSLGGVNCFTSHAERRGYYLSVSPVKREQSKGGYVMESYIGFTGFKKLIKEVARKSKKAESEAILLAEEHKEELIKYVLGQQKKAV